MEPEMYCKSPISNFFQRFGQDDLKQSKYLSSIDIWCGVLNETAVRKSSISNKNVDGNLLDMIPQPNLLCMR